MGVWKKFMGNGMDRMPDWAFRIMSFMFAVRDRFVSMDRLLDQFSIQEGQSVVDYGCGPGSYVSRASRLVGQSGKVYAVDIHELAVAAIRNKAAKEGLTNVSALTVQNGACPLEAASADVVYALDMFHMVSEPTAFLKEINRITKPSGILFIGDGHQPRKLSREKILQSGAWRVQEETSKYLKCTPIQ